MARSEAADTALSHDDPVEEVFEDQIACADLVVLNKRDLLDTAGVDKAMAAIYGALPSYRAMLDREGTGLGPADIAILGDEKSVRASLKRLADMGVTQFMGSVMNVGEGSTTRTRELLASLD